MTVMTSEDERLQICEIIQSQPLREIIKDNKIVGPYPDAGGTVFALRDAGFEIEKASNLSRLQQQNTELAEALEKLVKAIDDPVNNDNFIEDVFEEIEKSNAVLAKVRDQGF